jgi:HD-GYP domain-containing protein (c-di-GMP phosphodiesterase class II)
MCQLLTSARPTWLPPEPIRELGRIKTAAPVGAAAASMRPGACSRCRLPDGEFTLLRVPIIQARPYMVLALPVFNPQAPDQVLLKSGFTLNDSTIERLKKFNLSEIWIRYPGLESVEKYVRPELLQAQAILAQRIRDAFTAAEVDAVAKLDFNMYSRSIGQMVNELLANPAAQIFMDMLGCSGHPLMQHSLRVTYMAVLMGLKLEGYLVQERRHLDAAQATRVNSLGVGAMLHDIGLLKVPSDHHPTEETEIEHGNDFWRKHVTLGYDMVGEKASPSARAVILHHHQHYDGSGFPEHQSGEAEPEPLSGSQIHIFARIVCLANVFDRLREGPDVTMRPAVWAIRQVLAPQYRRWFDPQVLRAFLQVTPAYPPGTVLELSDGCKAVAIDHSIDDPCRPTVQLIGGLGPEDRAQPKFINLVTEPDLTVVRANGEDVSAYNFPSPMLLLKQEA